MNVLGKIVIPRTKMSIRYILNELEEIAREEFFRLKKILEVKRRKIKVDDEEIVSCPICLEAKTQEEIAKAKCIICGALLKPGKAKEALEDKDKIEDDKLEEFKAHIKEMIDISKDIEERGILSESVEEFLKTAEALKDKLDNKEIIGPIPSDIDIKQLCEKCKKMFDDQQAAKLEEIEELDEVETKEKEPEPVVHLPTPVPEIEPIQTPLPLPAAELCELHAPVEIDLELGTFETEIQEITKIVRIKNEDGTITEEKKVVKIKREVKAPVKTPSAAPSNPSRVPYQPSDESSTSNPYPGKKTVGMMKIESIQGVYTKHSACMNVNLDIYSESTMTDDSITHEHSTITLRYSVSDIDFEQKLHCDSNKASVSNIHRSSSSEEEFKSILSYIGCASDVIVNEDDKDQKACFTLSEMQLLSKILGSMPSARISKSVNNVFAGKITNIDRSISFNFDIT